MTPTRRSISGEQLVRALTRLGFIALRQRGSHVILVRETRMGRIGCVVPLHRTLAIGTLRSILRQAHVSDAVLARVLGA